MTNETHLEDWRPGDGLVCVHSAKAPSRIPCGRPVKTAVRVFSPRPGAEPRERRWPLCANHSSIGMPPSEVMTQARKQATERLIVAHWDQFETFLVEAIDQIRNAS